MAKTAKTRVFPDTTLPFNDSKQLSPVSDQALDISDVRFRRKCLITWFLRENGQILHQKRVEENARKPDLWAKIAKFWTKKGSKMVPTFCQNKNFHWSFLNNKLSLNNKKKQWNHQRFWKKMAKNSPKPSNVTTSNVFLSPKWPKRPKQEFS